MNSEFSYLKDLIEIVEREGKEHNKKKLWSLIARYAQEKIGILAKDDSAKLIAEVHELNLEQYIRLQATKFYEKFPLNELKYDLVTDFIQMEHCRRRDDFEGFSLAVFQQLENVTNYLFTEKNLWGKAKELSQLPMFTSYSKDGLGKRFGITLGEQLMFRKDSNLDLRLNEFFNKESINVNFLIRFKVILYFIYFKEKVTSISDWNQVYALGYNIYLSRNRNHRGSINSESQAIKQEIITRSRYNYYLLFSGFLADFFQKITIAFPEES